MIEITIPETKEFIRAAIGYLSDKLNENKIAADNYPIAAKNYEIAAEKLDSGEIDDDNYPIGDDFICPVTGERLDIENGYPWDERIHGEKKNKLSKTGEWKPLRGIEIKSPGLVAQVRAEFDARRNGKQTSLFDAPLSPVAPKPAVAKTPAPPAPPAPPTSTAFFELPTNPSFTDIVSYITCRVAFEPEYQEEINSILRDFTFTNLTQLKDCTPAVVKSFGEWLVYRWDMMEVA